MCFCHSLEAAGEDEDGPEFIRKPQPIDIDENQELLIVATIKGG